MKSLNFQKAIKRGIRLKIFLLEENSKFDLWDVEEVK